MFYVQYHGYVSIALWEYLLAFFYLLLIYSYFARKKNIAIRTAPEYKHFLWGLFAKLAGGIIFSLIYFYYYKGGDTISYFYSGVSMSKLAMRAPLDFLDVLLGETAEYKRNYFDPTIGYPYRYVYDNPRTFFVIRFISPLVILSLNSYLITTLLLAGLSYFGIWKCYRTFVGYYPALMNKFAIAFLYMPSVIFWGSAILKDTFTFSATCWWVHCLDELWFKKRNIISNAVGLILSGAVVVVVKPYIFMVLLPVSLIWIMHNRLSSIRNVLIRFFVLPLGAFGMLGSTIFVLDRLEDRLEKFSFDNALKTIEVSQEDMSRADVYGSNYFEIGELDGTWSGVLTKFPIAANAALFRPYLWESRSLVIAFSGLENLWILLLAIGTVLKARLFIVRALLGESRLMLSLTFALMFAFVVGVTTPNFGALVRFKIPLIPFFIASLYLIRFLVQRRNELQRRSRPFSFADYRHGDPIVSAADTAYRGQKGARAKRSRNPHRNYSGLAMGAVRSEENTPPGS